MKRPSSPSETAHNKKKLRAHHKKVETFVTLREAEQFLLDNVWTKPNERKEHTKGLYDAWRNETSWSTVRKDTASDVPIWQELTAAVARVGLAADAKIVVFSIRNVSETNAELVRARGVLLDRMDRHYLLLQEALSDFFENGSLYLHWVGPDGIIMRLQSCGVPRLSLIVHTRRANQRELEFLGYGREEYCNHPIAEFHVDQPVIAGFDTIYICFRDVFPDILTRLTRGERLADYEARLRCKDGSIKHVLIDSSVRRSPETGRFLHTRCFTRDITEKKKLELALRAAKEAAEAAPKPRITFSPC